MTKSFDSWFEDLISNYVWAEPAQMHHRPETFRKLAHKVYMQEVASGVFRPIQEARKHVYNIVCNTPGDAKKVDWAGKALKEMEQEKEKEWVPVSSEKRAEYLNQLQAIIKGSTMMSAVPRVTRTEQAAEAEGDWLPKKPAPYPQTSKSEAYVRLRHIEYVKANYESRTGAKLPSWVEEDEWNIQYDNDML